MELTIEQALQQGIAAHKEGKIQEAESLYRAILQSQPLHPDANHNLGVLAVSVKKTEAALPFFKAAIEANPKVEQFWLSYIDALIKTEKFDDVRHVLVDAHQAGVTSEKLQLFKERIQFKSSHSRQTTQHEFVNPVKSHQGDLLPAIELREIGKYNEAQEWLNKFIQQNPDHPEAFSLLSHILLLDKKDEEAESALIKASSLNSKLPSIYRNQARLLLKRAQAEEALEKAQLGYKQSPEDLETMLVLATCLGTNQRDIEALPIIETLLKTKPDYAEAYASRALIRLRANDITGSIEDAEMTVSLKPHLTQMWKLLGSLYHESGNLNLAIEALRRAHKNEPENTEFMIQLGELLRQDNKGSEAISILKKATELSPKDSNAWINLGAALQQEEKLEDAKIIYDIALDLNPNSAIIASNLGAMAKEAEEWDAALLYFKKALEIEPNLSEVHSNLGNILRKIGKFDESESSCRKAIELNPDFAQAHNNLGVTLKLLGRLDEAEVSYKKAISLKPDYVAAHSNIGNVYQELARIDEANASYLKAIELDPDYADAYWNLHGVQKNIKDGEYWIDKCLIADSNHQLARLIKAALRFYQGDKDSFNELKKSELNQHPHMRTFSWVFSLPNLPELHFNKFYFFDAIIKKSIISKPFYEFGVWRASSFKYLLKYFKKGYGFDTFTGLPEDWDLGKRIEKAGTYSNDGNVPKIKGGEFIVGKFEDTLPVFFSKSRPTASLINFDADLYSSTICALNHSKSVIDKDTILIFDEFIINDSWEQDEFKALNEFCLINNCSYEVLAISFFTKQVAVKLIDI